MYCTVTLTCTLNPITLVDSRRGKWMAREKCGRLFIVYPLKPFMYHVTTSNTQKLKKN